MLSNSYKLSPAGVWSRENRPSFNYSDGNEIENRILSQIRNSKDVSLASDELQRLMVDWPSEYHYSPLRANLLSAFCLDNFQNILEIGSGCGAITRQLGEQCPNSSIVALEGSPRRAEITKARIRDLDNVQVCSDSFTDFQCDTLFDLITFIGVLEYSPSFFIGDNPVLQALQKAYNKLEPDGSLVIAIENQLGLKYFNGAAEDHTGKAFKGINNLYPPGTAQTFGRKDLHEILSQAGFENIEFIYPFPDYKLPQLLLREESFESSDFDLSYLLGQYPAQDYGFDSDKLFMESRVWNLAAKNNLVRDLANSFLIFAFKGSSSLQDVSDPWLAKAFSGRRKKQYLIETDFSYNADKIEVTKSISYPNAADEFDAQNSPTTTTKPNAFIHHLGKAQYIDGVPYTYTLTELLEHGSPFDSFLDYLSPWVAWLREQVIEENTTGQPNLEKLPGQLYDCMPANFIFKDNQLCIIDQEWESGVTLELGFVLFRGLYREISANLEYFEQLDLFKGNSILDFLTRVFTSFALNMDERLFDSYITLEAQFQLEIVPYNSDIDGLKQHLSVFFHQKPNKRSTVAELISDGIVRKYSLLEQQYGLLQEQNSILQSQKDSLHNEATELGTVIIARDEHIGELSRTVMERDKYIDDLLYILSVRESTIDSVMTSSSWRLTAPLRLAGFLIKGDFKNGRLLFKEIVQSIVTSPQRATRKIWPLIGGKLETSTDSESNLNAIQAIVKNRCEMTSVHPQNDPLTATSPVDLPEIDISIVTFNSKKWVDGFIQSLLALDYPKSLLNLRFIDNGSTDETISRLEGYRAILVEHGFQMEVHQQPNLGYGGGHNRAIQLGNAPFCLITNIDLTFHPDSLRKVISTAISDAKSTAAWELRQIPYEHPKFYDPVTGLTNWNSHACIVFRRSSLIKAGLYDETLFMYGEDVELSYRLRSKGFHLRYCPAAVVNHFSYDHAGQIKPIQYSGSTFANLYLRMKYGTSLDRKAIPYLLYQLLSAKPPFKGARRKIIKNILKLIKVSRKTIRFSESTKQTANTQNDKTAGEIFFPFRSWDYDLVKTGAFLAQKDIAQDPPLVSIITRTYKGRELFLRQAMLSVAHQTYSQNGNIEHIIVEDGGESMRSVVENMSELTGQPVKFIANEKLGRSSAGNVGLANSAGKWCMFLDDDDLLFAEHVEVLVAALLEDKDTVAAYSEAWEVETDTTQISEGYYQEKNHIVPQVLQEEYSYKALCHHNLMAIQSILFERSLYEVRGGFDSDLDVLEDWVLWVCYGYESRFVKVPRVTSLYRTPFDQQIRTHRQQLIDEGYQPAIKRAQERISDFGATVKNS